MQGMRLYRTPDAGIAKWKENHYHVANRSTIPTTIRRKNHE
jgi:hypothetical protein